MLRILLGITQRERFWGDISGVLLDFSKQGHWKLHRKDTGNRLPAGKYWSGPNVGVSNSIRQSRDGGLWSQRSMKCEPVLHTGEDSLDLGSTTGRRDGNGVTVKVRKQSSEGISVESFSAEILRFQSHLALVGGGRMSGRVDVGRCTLSFWARLVIPREL